MEKITPHQKKLELIVKGRPNLLEQQLKGVKIPPKEIFLYQKCIKTLHKHFNFETKEKSCALKKKTKNFLKIFQFGK